MSWFRKPKVTVSVTEGQIPVNSIDKTVDHKDVKVYHLDSSAKYYEPCFYTNYEEDDHWLVGVALGSNERTLRSNPGLPCTDITFKIPKKSKNDKTNWYIEAWSSRYTTVILIYTFSRTRIQEFLKEDFDTVTTDKVD
jgi:hypothetical protein